MAPLVWVTTAIAIWHFTVFIPDRFWAGIVGALLGSTGGAIVTGAIGQIATGGGIGETDLATVIWAIPGSLLGLGAVYLLGARAEQRSAAQA